MRISRLFVPNLLVSGQDLTLDQDTAHYVRTVLRLRAGDMLTLFNGAGGEFSGKVDRITRKDVVVRIGDWTACERESPLKIHLGLGISRGERMSFAIQKGVELGVSQIFPIATQRSVVKLSEDKSQARQQHWQKISQNASEQCGRDRLVPVNEIVELDHWLANMPTGCGILLDPRGRHSVDQVELNPDQPVNLCIGPEGGLTPEEQEKLISHGFTPTRLGPRVLRTETAVLAALTALQVCWGDLRK